MIDGFLDKENHSFRGGYQKRFIRLFDGRYLCYFESDKALKPKGVIDLVTVETIEERKDNVYPTRGDPCRFVLPGPRQACVLKAESDQERQRWLRALRSAMSELQAQREPGKPLPDKNDEAVKEGLALFGSEDYHCKTGRRRPGSVAARIDGEGNTEGDQERAAGAGALQIDVRLPRQKARGRRRGLSEALVLHRLSKATRTDQNLHTPGHIEQSQLSPRRLRYA